MNDEGRQLERLGDNGAWVPCEWHDVRKGDVLRMVGVPVFTNETGEWQAVGDYDPVCWNGYSGFPAVRRQPAPQEEAVV